jgi:predicted nucleic acid-binding protein
MQVITLGELRLGIEDLPAGKRRSDLEDWLAVGLPNWFAGNLLPVTADIVERWAKLTVTAKRKGKTVSMPDGLIAATALQHGLTLVTRNVSDFEYLGIALLNPWTLLH